ncbi:MAG: STAS domain-containing protein [Anaerolineae bacterium]|nr:STAS domain-containing protein [Anaerolineae bacterium]
MDRDAREARLLGAISALGQGGTPDAIGEALARGLVGAGLDRCEVFLGVVYQEDALAEGACVALADAGDQTSSVPDRAPLRTADLPALGRALGERVPQWLDAQDQGAPLGEAERELLDAAGLVGMLICPMVAADRCLGYVLAGTRSRDRIGDQDAVLYQAIAAQAAAAIEAARAGQRYQRAEQERRVGETVAREQLIGELAVPLIPITDNILVLPLVGSVDSARAEQIMTSLLDGIERHDAEVVIVDVTGVPLMDTAVANYLLRMTHAASLVGARTILVGITPLVAQTIVELGVDLSSITTRSDLQGGVEYALRLQGQHIAPIRGVS